MISVTVLITAAGGALSPLNIKLLRASRRFDVNVIAVDAHADAQGRHFANRFVQVPSGGDPDYASAIAEVVSREAVDIVLPCSDEEAMALAAHRSDIEASGTRLACADLGALSIMNDKGRTYAHFADSPVRVPDWQVAPTGEALAAMVESHASAGYECVVKPPIARGNRGTYVLRNQIEEEEYFAGSRELHLSAGVFLDGHLGDVALPAIVMQRLFAPAYDIDVLARQGVLVRAMPRERINPAGVPFTGGILRTDPEFLAIAEHVANSLSLDWLYDIDLMTDATGHPVLLELNPRPSGSIAAAVLAGVPFYDDLIALALGEPTADVDLPDNVTVVPYTDCVVAAPECQA